MRKLFFLFLLLSGASKVMQAQITWNFGTTTVSGTAAVGALSTNITATALSATTQVQNSTTSVLFLTTPALATASVGYTGASGAFCGNAFSKAGVLATTTSTYLQFVIRPTVTTSWINITAISWGNLSLALGGPTNFTLYSSVDNYTTPIGTATAAIGTTTWSLISPTITPVTGAAGAAVTIRIYGYGGTGTPSATVPNWRVDDVTISATAQTSTTTVGQIPKYTGPTTFTNSVITENNGKIGVGIATPSEKLDVTGNIKFSGALMPNGDAGTTTTPLYLKSAGANAPPVWAPIATSGEANTSSNVGTVGTGLFKQKTGVNLEFYKLNPLNSKVTVALNGTDRIDLGVNEANFTNIPNSGLTNSSITIGSTNISLGSAAVTSINGLASVNSTTFNGALNGNATTANTATNIAGSAVGSIPYQTAAGVTGMLIAGATNNVLTMGANGLPSWASAPSATSTAWGLQGNSNATVTSFLGTPTGTDIDLVFKRNGVLSGKINSSLNLTTFGVNSGSANTTGVGNTFLGSQSGYTNTIASYNSFVGFATGSLNTGVANTFMGALSGNLNTTGGSNTFIGYYAGGANTTGNSNNFLGQQAGFANTTGGNNNFIGHIAGAGNTIGVNNNFIGYNAGALNTTGNNNIVIGGSTLSDATLASNNTAIGSNTGRGIITGGNNTIVGANVTGLPATLSNNIILADGAGNRRINVNDLGNVGIGTTTPRGLLDVNGGSAYIGSSSNSVKIDATSIKMMDNSDTRSLEIEATKGKFGQLNSQTYSPLNTAILNASSNLDGTEIIRFRNNPNNSYLSMTQVNTNYAATNFVQNGNSQLYLAPSGNIGIGITTPTEKLDVIGNIYTNDKIFIGTRGDGTAQNPALTPAQLGGGHKLFVNGSAIFTKAVVRLTSSWADYVFEPTYKLPTLAEVEAYLVKNKHLQDVPSAAEVKEKGIDLGDNQTILLKKVEELTLYMIELNKKVELLAKENEELKKKVNGDK